MAQFRKKEEEVLIVIDFTENVGNDIVAEPNINPIFFQM